jgi:hypothetical protein
MPLSGKDGLARFRLRYEDRLRDQYRTDLQALGIGLASFAITEDTSAEAVTQFLTEVVQLPDDLASLCQQGGAR